MYNIIIKIDDDEIKTSINGKNWDDICDYVMGRIEIIPACGNCHRVVDEMGDLCERCKALNPF